MEPITSQRGRKRAETERAMVTRQLADLEKKRQETNAGFDAARDLLREQLHQLEQAIEVYDNSAHQLRLREVAG